MLLSLDHEKESVINFHLHLFVVGCDQLLGIDEFVHFDTLIVLIILVVCLYRLTSTSSSCCFSQRASMLSNIHCILGARINAPRLVNAK